MPNGLLSEYQRAQVRARAIEGRLTAESTRQIAAALERYADSLASEISKLSGQPAADLRATRDAMRLAARRMRDELIEGTAATRAASFDEVSKTWRSIQLEVAEAAGVDRALMGAVRSPPITMLGAYENLGGGAAHWRTLLAEYVDNAVAEVELIMQEGLAAGVDPERLARRLRPYVLGAEDLGGAFGDLEDLNLQRLRAESPQIRGAARRMRFNARRIAWSEVHNARAEAELTQMAADPLVQAIRWEIAPDRGSLRPPDICDSLADEDWYGLGAGVYPVDSVPLPPHPFDRCERIPVLRPRQQAGQPKPLNLPLARSPADLTISNVTSAKGDAIRSQLTTVLQEVPGRVQARRLAELGSL